MLSAYHDAIAKPLPLPRIGQVCQLTGLAIEASGPDAAIGELCTVRARDHGSGTGILAEVVGFRQGRVILMPYGGLDGIAVGCEVVAIGAHADIGVGDGLLGRVIDGFGAALDGRPAPILRQRRALKASPLNPLQRPRIERLLETGVRAIDSLLTPGLGQRLGIFAGSGVGKSTLLGMMARHVKVDLNVIALIGERGREVREFIETQLGAQGLSRSVVVVATSDQPALARLRAAYAAVAIAEHFRDAGRQVLLTMDSLTRFAMARREVGLAAGEPPTARGYTPSVFSELPELCERCGTSPSGGSISALLSVLVEGDDMSEPIADCLRATLDGHIVLSRELAQQGRFPAIDVQRSVSRLMHDLVTPSERTLAAEVVKCLAVLERNRAMVDIGAYESGSNPVLDQALAIEAALRDFLQQSGGRVARSASLARLQQIMGGR